MATSDLFRFLAFSVHTGEAVGCGSTVYVARRLAAEDGVQDVEVLQFDGSNGSRVWERFIPLHVARDNGETVWRSETLSSRMGD